MTRRLVYWLALIVWLYVWSGIAWINGGLQPWVYRWLG